MVELGYAVVNVPFKGYSNNEIDVNGIGLETEIRDFKFALASLPTTKSFNLKDMSDLGFSFGGQSAVGLVCRNSNIKLVISYDGGIGTKFGSRLIDESPFCGTENISTSILHIYDTTYAQNYLDKIKSFVYSDRTVIGLDQIAHWHFTSFGYLASQFPKLFGENEYSIHGYDTILEITKNFLHANSKNQNGIYHYGKNEYNLISEVEHYQPIKK